MAATKTKPSKVPSKQIEVRLTSEISLDPENARKHSDASIEAVAKSLQQFGQQSPIVLDADDIVVKGNGTFMAAMKLGWTEIETVKTTLTGSQLRAYAIADNRTAELSEWNTERLLAQLESFEDAAIKAATGYDEAAVLAICAEVRPAAESVPIEVVEDEVPEPPEPRTKIGDLWLMGDHRLLCGDATAESDVSRLMDGAKAQLFLTDPPYNVDYTGKTADAIKVGNDNMDDQEFREFLRLSLGNGFASIDPGSAYYIWHADVEAYNFYGAVQDCGHRVRQCLIWIKNSMILGRRDYHFKHEPCLYGWHDKGSHHWYSDRTQTTILEFDRPSRSSDHPTTKPVTMFAYLMGNSSKPGDTVLDLFGGSGTTLMAADATHRKCYMMELNPVYCDVIVARWEAKTGQRAVLSQ